ncbi:MAG: putative lipid II flippase FtsW [Acidobacteria bacterium]|nr:putative lipid II flippase FtsW [Acidobacteriota bacterium]
MAAKRSFDPIIFTLVVLLSAGGLLMIYSASAVISQRQFGTPYHFLRQQSIALVAGLAGMVLLMKIDYRRLQSPWLTRGLLAVTLVLLVLALLGAPTNGTHRWLRLPGASFQPSELAKLAVLLFLAEIVARRQAEIAEPRGPILGGLVAAGVVVALVAVQPDLGTALAIAMVTGALLFAAGMKARYLLVPALLVMAAITVSVVFNDYQRGRIETFLNPDGDPGGAGYQVRQSRIAVASGGVTGRGLGEGGQKLFFLPYPHTDFVFSNIGEELGLVGTVTVLAAFLVLMARGLYVASRAPDTHLALLACGVTVMLVGQAFINMGVCLGILPAKGLPLPFISYGGSSMVVSLLSAGVLLNASQYGS